MEKEIISVIKYFSFFAYQPTLEEIYTFLPIKISKKQLKYTPPQYSIGRKILNIKYQISKRKLHNWRYRTYIKFLSLFPQIKLIGLSGSISMMNAEENDDIDLFVITAKNRLFTGRLIALVLAQVLGLRRNREARSQNFLAPVGTLPARSGVSQVAKNFNSSLSSNNETIKQFNNHIRNKVCLNLFFDESRLQVPKFKQTEFVGHEVLQMKPIINKNYTYEKFLEANKWVFRLFPNARENLEFRIQNSELKNKILNFKSIHNSKFIILNFGWIIELILKKIQLFSINRHRTSEIITSTQLWFHPDDFEKKIKQQGRTTA